MGRLVQQLAGLSTAVLCHLLGTCEHGWKGPTTAAMWDTGCPVASSSSPFVMRERFRLWGFYCKGKCLPFFFSSNYLNYMCFWGVFGVHLGEPPHFTLLICLCLG